MHAEPRIDDSVVMLGQPEKDLSLAPCHVHVYVPDVDATYAKPRRSTTERRPWD